jgi:hypothetical protein
MSFKVTFSNGESIIVLAEDEREAIVLAATKFKDVNIVSVTYVPKGL